MIKMVVFDIDGVISDGKRYTNGGNLELKTIQLKDLDAIGMLADNGYKLGCISGEDTEFSRQFLSMRVINYIKLGCKDKGAELKSCVNEFGIQLKEVCYIGDGKYDIPALQLAGLGVCPNDAIEEVKNISDIVLRNKGGEGCIAECCSILLNYRNTQKNTRELSENDLERIQAGAKEHQIYIQKMLDDKEYFSNVYESIKLIVENYRNHRTFFIYGNRENSVLAQYLAAELTKCFCLGRKAWSPEILMNNTLIAGALAKVYGCHSVLAQEIEAKMGEGDVLLGIITDEITGNIYEGFKKAKMMGVMTILMTDKTFRCSHISKYVDCILSVSSKDALRTREIYIMTSHLICEGVEWQLIKQNL